MCVKFHYDSWVLFARWFIYMNMHITVLLLSETAKDCNIHTSVATLTPVK
jgi:hypothetical protein